MKKRLTKEEYGQLPDFMQDAYEQADDGSYVLGQIEGMVEKKRLDEFRTNNRELQRRLEEMEERMTLFADIDPEKHKEMQEEQRKIQEKEWIEAGEIDKIVEHRLKPVVEAKDREISKLKESVGAAEGQLSQLLIDNNAAALAVELGVEPSALPDVMHRARGQFRIHEGKARAFDEEGNIRYQDDGVTPVALDKSWMEGLKKNASHLFQRPQGTGTENGSGTRHGSNQQDRGNMSAVSRIQAGLAERAERG